MIFTPTVFILFFKKLIFIKYFYYLHDGDDDDEMSVVEVIEIELPDEDNHDTGGLDTVDGVEFILISISIIYYPPESVHHEVMY